MIKLMVRIVMSLLSVLPLSAVAQATDWPMLGRDQARNAVSPETGAPLDWHPGEFDGLTGVRTEKGRATSSGSPSSGRGRRATRSWPAGSCGSVRTIIR